MIQIDFYGGAHGNYLEFVCNKIAGVTSGSPFDHTGAAHAKRYCGKKMFEADHYSFRPRPLLFDKIISIQIDVHDLLSLHQVSLLRTGKHGFDNNQLESDTYNKLNNPDYRGVLDDILQGFFTNQIQNSYNAVKDPAWPSIITLADFKNLPNHIRQECIEQHKLQLLELSPEYPDCPRSILREFFQVGFKNPEKSGFMTQQKYHASKQVFVFPFNCFYDKTKFLHKVKKIANWAQIAYTCEQDIEQLHDEFLQRQPYKNSKHKCDNIVRNIQDKKLHAAPVNLLEEAYINNKLNWNYY